MLLTVIREVDLDSLEWIGVDLIRCFFVWCDEMAANLVILIEVWRMVGEMRCK